MSHTEKQITERSPIPLSVLGELFVMHKLGERIVRERLDNKMSSRRMSWFAPSLHSMHADDCAEERKVGSQASFQAAVKKSKKYGAAKSNIDEDNYTSEHERHNPKVRTTVKENSSTEDKDDFNEMKAQLDAIKNQLKLEKQKSRRLSEQAETLKTEKENLLSEKKVRKNISQLCLKVYFLY